MYDLNEVIAGFVAGVIGTIIGFPLDTIKTRMQTSLNSTVSMHEMAGVLYRENGISSFYRGVSSPLAGIHSFTHHFNCMLTDSITHL